MNNWQSFIAHNCKKIENFTLFIIDKLENQKIGLTAWLISFFAVIFLRNFLETISSRADLLSWDFLFFHSTAYYFCSILTLILFAYFLTKEKIEKISKIALFGVFLILIPPILDLIFTRGVGGIETKYGDFSSFDVPVNLFKILREEAFFGPAGILFGFFSKYPLQEFSYNLGIRINCLVIYLFFLWYVFLKTKSILKVILALFLFYCTSFIFYIFPFIFSVILKIPPTSASFHNVSTLNSSFEWNKIIFSLYFILAVIFSCLWFFIYNKEKFLAILKNLRPERFIHNLIMLGLGVYIAKVSPMSLTFFDWLLVIMAGLSVFLYWLSVIGFDDIADEKIDKISNPKRPLPRGKISKEEFKTINNILRIASFLCAFVVGYTFFVLIFLRSLLGHIYYAHPFRLKRFPILATSLLALTALLTVFGGFVLAGKNVLDFPMRLMLFILLAFTFGFMTKDIKDYEGDKADRIYTVPVIFGLKRGKTIIGFLALFIFLLAPFVFSQHFNILIIPSLLAGTLGFWLINRKKYNEKPLFFIYFFYGIFFILTIFK